MEKYLLVVDDNIEISEIIQEVLGGLFDKVFSAQTVEQAQELLDQHIFSYVILDINLEGRNGGEVVKYLQDHPENPNKSTPFIVVSGIINPDFIARNARKFSGILMKPFEPEELIGLIQRGLNGNEHDEMSIPETVALDEIPYLKCDSPFPIVELEKRVNRIMDQVKKNAKLKVLFTKMKIERHDDYFLTYIGVLINVATGICIQLEWDTDRTLEKMVYAAYLHDMALAQRPDLARIKDKEELELKKESLTASEYKLVWEHANIAARTIDEHEEFPADVGMIVRHHHELPRENGFPAGISYNKISPLATVFIVAHDMTHFILDNEKWTLPEYINQAKMKFKGVHFQKVLSALNEIK